MRINPISIIFLAPAFLLAACKSPKEKLASRWVFTSLQTPTTKAMADAYSAEYMAEATEGLKKKVQGNRLILNEDGQCYGVLLDRYFIGRWEWGSAGPCVYTHILYPKKLDMRWEVHITSSKQVEFSIDAEKLQRLSHAVKDTTDSANNYDDMLDKKGIWTMVAEKELEKFDKLDADPWSPELNRWRLKPTTPETQEQLKKRVRNHMHFMYSFFSFAMRPERFWVSQDWFYSVIKPGNNGIAVFSQHKIPPRWYRCFYDSAQAIEGYNMIRRTFYAKIDLPDKDAGSIEFNKVMLGRLLEVLDKGK